MSQPIPRPQNHPLFNPDAGVHPLPDDPREIAAVRRATQRCFDVHPYFVARYGDRGRAFADSDGGYLVTLTRSWQSYVNEQVLWLATLLSARGMPCWLMEVHLGLLREELRQAWPQDAARFAKLARAAAALRRRRRSRLAQADFDRIAAAFDATAGAGLANAGCLIVAAVSDERGGLAQAVPSLLAWLGDPARFSPSWCGAVARALADARAAQVPTPA